MDSSTAFQDSFTAPWAFITFIQRTFLKRLFKSPKMCSTIRCEAVIYLLVLHGAFSVKCMEERKHCTRGHIMKQTQRPDIKKSSRQRKNNKSESLRNTSNTIQYLSVDVGVRPGTSERQRGVAIWGRVNEIGIHHGACRALYFNTLHLRRTRLHTDNSVPRMDGDAVHGFMYGTGVCRHTRRDQERKNGNK